MPRSTQLLALAVVAALALAALLAGSLIAPTLASGSLDGRTAAARAKEAATAPHAGTWGFFQAPGTNDSVGSTPVLAARLDRLGTALHLHLVGLSGYRMPQHSVEVGGFANDPHTRGEASDTPGVEGVPEGTLLRFGLTRRPAGAHEADHIQLA